MLVSSERGNEGVRARKITARAGRGLPKLLRRDRGLDVFFLLLIISVVGRIVSGKACRFSHAGTLGIIGDSAEGFTGGVVGDAIGGSVDLCASDSVCKGFLIALVVNARNKSSRA